MFKLNASRLSQGDNVETQAMDSGAMDRIAQLHALLPEPAPLTDGGREQRRLLRQKTWIMGDEKTYVEEPVSDAEPSNNEARSADGKIDDAQDPKEEPKKSDWELFLTPKPKSPPRDEPGIPTPEAKADGYEGASPIPATQPRPAEDLPSEPELVPDVPLETRDVQQRFKSKAEPRIEDIEEGGKRAAKKGKGKGRGRGRSGGRGMKRPARRTTMEKPVEEEPVEEEPEEEEPKQEEPEEEQEAEPVKEKGGKRKREKGGKCKAEPKSKVVRSGKGEESVAEKASSRKGKTVESAKEASESNEKGAGSKDGAELRLTFAGRRPPKTQCAHDRYLALQTIYLKRVLPQLPEGTNLKGTSAEARLEREEG